MSRIHHPFFFCFFPAIPSECHPSWRSCGQTLCVKDFRLTFNFAAEFPGRGSTPLLIDKKQNKIVNNESAEIIRIFNSAFQVMWTTEAICSIQRLGRLEGGGRGMHGQAKTNRVKFEDNLPFSFLWKTIFLQTQSYLQEFCKTPEQKELDLYPKPLREEIDELNGWIYP